MNPSQLAALTPSLTNAHIRPGITIEGPATCYISPFAIIAGDGSPTQANTVLSVAVLIRVNGEEWCWFSQQETSIPFEAFAQTTSPRQFYDGYFLSLDLNDSENYRIAVQNAGKALLTDAARAIESLHHVAPVKEIHHTVADWGHITSPHQIISTWESCDAGPHYLNEAQSQVEAYARKIRSRTAGTIVVATDASKRKGSRISTIAYVCESGEFRTKTSRCPDIDDLELGAIRMALNRFHDVPCQRLRILTDSQNARDAILKELESSGQSSPHIDIVWVRGHSGHPLNEAAHRLAMSRRRTAEVRKHDHFTSISANIIADYFSDLSPTAA